jgi:[ribosomal protein S5]-alanine N-acetyltransferase
MLPDRFETSRLILRPIAAHDAPAILAGYAQDPDVVRFLTGRPHRGLVDTEAYVARCTAAPADRSRTYVLIGRADGRLLAEAPPEVAGRAMRQDAFGGSVPAAT